MGQEITFIHAADLHLDSPFRGLSHLPHNILQSVQASTFQAFHNLITLAIERQVDFILLAGDLFDVERQTLKSQIQLRNAFRKLEAHHIQVFISHGNHDFIKGNLHRVAFPDNVTSFESDTVSTVYFRKKHNTTVAISGFSYMNRQITEEKAFEFPLRDSSVDYHIGMYHGSIYGDKLHDTYAPFRLNELIEKNYDYWALGHIHKRRVLQANPPIIYSGNTQGRHRHEQGEKGCYLVTLSKDEQFYEFAALAPINFHHAAVDLDVFNHIDEIEAALLKQFKALPHDKNLISLQLQTTNENFFKFNEANLFRELIDSLNEAFNEEVTWRYIYRFKFYFEEKVSLNYPEPFRKELIEAIDNISIQESLAMLKQNNKLKPFLDIDENEIYAEAKANLTQVLSLNQRGVK